MRALSETANEYCTAVKLEEREEREIFTG